LRRDQLHDAKPAPAFENLPQHVEDAVDDAPGDVAADRGDKQLARAFATLFLDREPAPSVNVSVMIRPNSTSPMRVAGSRYLSTKDDLIEVDMGYSGLRWPPC